MGAAEASSQHASCRKWCHKRASSVTCFTLHRFCSTFFHLPLFNLSSSLTASVYRWRLSPRSWSTARSSIFVVRPYCGALLKAWRARPRSSTWRPCGWRSTRLAHSVPWVLTRWPSPLCVARTRRTKSNPGYTSNAATCMATTTGATTARRGRVGRAGRGSVPCAELKGLTCHCGWAARQGFMSMPPRPLTPSTLAAMFAQTRRQPSGVRSHCPTEHTPSMQPALSVRSSWLASRATSDSSSRAPSTSRDRFPASFGWARVGSFLFGPWSATPDVFSLLCGLNINFFLDFLSLSHF